MGARERRPNILGELGLVIEPYGDELRGTAQVVPAMAVPGTSALRASVVIAWADTLLGLLAVRILAPRVPVTLELDVHLLGPLLGGAADTGDDSGDGTTGDGTTGSRGMLTLTGRVLKAGRSVLVSRMGITDGPGRTVGVGHALFMANPDPRMTMPTGNWALDRFGTRYPCLDEPFAARVGCERTGPGTAALPRVPEVLNQSRTINGGLLGVVVEEAALSAEPAGRPLSSVHMRYLRPVREGPAVARAEVGSGLGEVEVRDAATGTLAVVATTRAAEAPRPGAT